METEKLLTAKEVAEMLHVSPSAVYLWASQGAIPFVALKQGRRKTVTRFRKSSIEYWLKKCEKTPKKIVPSPPESATLIINATGNERR